MHAIFVLECVHCSIEILYIVIRPIVLSGWKILFEMMWANKTHRSENGFEELFDCSSLSYLPRFFFLLHRFSSCIILFSYDQNRQCFERTVFFSGAKLLLLGVSC